MSDKPSEATSSTFVDSFARGLGVIEAFGAGQSELSMTQVATAAGISRAAARRLLLTLCHLGYAHESAGGFRLTPKIMRLGYAYLSGLTVAEIAEPFVVELAEATGESCSVCILDDTEVVYVCRASTRRVMSLNLSVGTRLPAWATAHGRLLLADLADRDLQDRLARSGVRKMTPRSETDLEKLSALIRRAGQEGHCLVDQELELGLTAVAVPLHGRGGKVVAAINVAGHADRISPEQMLVKHLSTLQQAADRIEQALMAR
ncbi:MAG: IclR family transcriptional regulator C-terminal domain-containing protein [Polaromonas sp.]|nr:IclR family transcriptional regulator C-terminal domain-containing protein [Polaromonas sp.]